MNLAPHHVLILPGWLNSGPDHWQSLWQAAHGYTRVDQHDWARPLRGDWITRLEEVVLAQTAHSTSNSTNSTNSTNLTNSTTPTTPTAPVTLVAHSLGCLLVAAWAALSRNTHRIHCAFLVAPCDVAAPHLPPALFSWKPPASRDPSGLGPDTLPHAVPHAAPHALPQTLPFKSLPFRSLVVASQTDPYCSFAQAQALAASWGSTLIDCGERGHINAESGLGDWPAGHDLLRALQRGDPITGAIKS